MVQEGRRRGLSDDFRRAILERVKSKLRFNRTLEVLGISRGSLHNYLHGLRRVPDDVIYRALRYLEEWEFNEVVRGVDMLRTAGSLVRKPLRNSEFLRSRLEAPARSVARWSLARVTPPPLEISREFSRELFRRAFRKAYMHPTASLPVVALRRLGATRIS